MKQYVESLQEALAREVEKHECLWEWHSTYWQTSCGHRTDNFNSGRCPYCYQTLVQTPTVHPLLIDLPKLEFNTEKAIASALMDALKIHEGSYDSDVNEYTKLMEDCLIESCKKHGLEENMWALLNLAMHWGNDVQLWCEDILAGRSVIDSCVKAKATQAPGPNIDLCDTCAFDFASCDRSQSMVMVATYGNDDDNVIKCGTYKRA